MFIVGAFPNSADISDSVLIVIIKSDIISAINFIFSAASFNFCNSKFSLNGIIIPWFKESERFLKNKANLCPSSIKLSFIKPSDSKIFNLSLKLYKKKGNSSTMSVIASIF